VLAKNVPSTGSGSMPKCAISAAATSFTRVMLVAGGLLG